MIKSSKGPEHIAWASFVLSLVFFGVTLGIGRWSGFFCVLEVAWFTLASSLIWLVLALQFHHHCLAEQEKLDMTQLVRDDKSSTIFQGSEERVALMAVAQHRLQVFEKWFLPLFSLLLAAVQLGLGIYLLRLVLKGAEQTTRQPLIAVIASTAMAFVCFLLSRYATGMSGQSSWRPLRAGGSALLAVALLFFIQAIGLGFAQFQFFYVINVLHWIVPVLLVLLGIETLLNFIMDIYRPRVKGQYNRAAFDSRLLGIFNEPGGILHSAANAIDYQFGFKVSQTWFYQLLQRAIIPLIIFGAVTLYLLSCIVVISPDEEAVIERFGNPLDGDYQPRHIGPGLVLKWPWPIDVVQRYPTQRIKQLYIGYVPETDENGNIQRGPLLWGKTHYQEEHDVLVASEYRSDDTQGALPVSLVKANLPVQYRIKDIYAYLYNHTDPDILLEAICYHELARYAASAKVEVDTTNPQDLRESLLGTGRSLAGVVLKERIQAAADDVGLGVDVLFLGLQGIHPPPEVAENYHAVVGAVQERQTSILEAHAERNKRLCSVAGSVDNAVSLYGLAEQFQQARKTGDMRRLADLAEQLDAAFTQAEGDIFETLRRAQADAYVKPTLAQANGWRFQGQVEAFHASPDIYKRQQRLLAMQDALASIRKYVLFSDPEDEEVFIIDLHEKLLLGLSDVGMFGENEEP